MLQLDWRVWVTTILANVTTILANDVRCRRVEPSTYEPVRQFRTLARPDTNVRHASSANVELELLAGKALPSRNELIDRREHSTVSSSELCVHSKPLKCKNVEANVEAIDWTTERYEQS